MVEPIAEDRLNSQGGAIAIGQPVGAGGARLDPHLTLFLQAAGARLGVASLCIGGGQSGPLLIERED